MKKLYAIFAGALAVVACAAPAFAGSVDDAGYPVFYLRGAMTDDGWGVNDHLRFSRNEEIYSLHLDQLSGEFKISNDDWTINFGRDLHEDVPEITSNCILAGIAGAPNFSASNLEDVTISFAYDLDNPSYTVITFQVKNAVVAGLSGSLPVLYINVFDENGVMNNEIISMNLDHKNYFSGHYWLDLNGCDWLAEEGAKSIGSAEEPLELEIKARGNWTRIGYSKKPFKLKLAKKQSLLGMTKSKHYAILAHADDNKGYLRNFTGFNLGKRMGLPWTPWQQPVEVVINGDYRGLYFLTESIRVDADRVPIEELGDNVDDPSLVSGGYLIELDNYDEVNQIRMEEKGCTGHYRDMLRVTFDTPEIYSDLQRRFVQEQFSTMNDLVGANSDDLWRYIDIDDLARYYLVEEIISHVEAFHGSTYMFRDRGADQKWHFSPLWDCGNGFNGPTNGFFYDHAPYGSTWIPSIRCNAKFNEKVKETWLWFMSTQFDGLYKDIDEYAARLLSAAEADHRRWDGKPIPGGGMPVVDNRDMNSRKEEVRYHLSDKINWLKAQFGDYTTGCYAEPARDTTPAAPLPDYVTTEVNEIDIVAAENGEVTIYDLQGMRVSDPQPGCVYIVVKGSTHSKVIF